MVCRYKSIEMSFLNMVTVVKVHIICAVGLNTLSTVLSINSFSSSGSIYSLHINCPSTTMVIINPTSMHEEITGTKYKQNSYKM